MHPRRQVFCSAARPPARARRTPAVAAAVALCLAIGTSRPAEAYCPAQPDGLAPLTTGAVRLDSGLSGVRSLSAPDIAAFPFTVPPPCIDADGDGVCPPEDCDDTNAAIRPLRAEICADGIDSDCDGDASATEPGCDCVDADQDGFCALDGADCSASITFAGERQLFLPVVAGGSRGRGDLPAARVGPEGRRARIGPKGRPGSGPKVL